MTGQELNPFDASYWGNPYLFYPTLLNGPPLRLQSLFPAIVVARYNHVVGVLRQPILYSSRLPDISFVRKFDPFHNVTSMLASDPPLHTRLRRQASIYFRQSRMEEFVVSIRARVGSLLDQIAIQHEFDAVSDFAEALTNSVNADILGIPLSDYATLKRWSNEIFTSVRRSLMIAATMKPDGKSAGGDHSAIDAYEAESLIETSIPDSVPHAVERLRDYFSQVIARRRVEPRNDFVSALMPALDDSSFGVAEVLGLIELVLLAGSETTSSLISNGLLAFCTHRSQLNLIKSNPELVPLAVEEILRFDSPVQMIMRYASSSSNIDGIEIPDGATILVMLGAANRDPDIFEHSDHFDVRRNPNAHLAFGDGIHTCMGGQLARLQGRIALSAIFDRFPNLALAEPHAPLKYDGSLLSRTLSSLPMVTNCAPQKRFARDRRGSPAIS